MAVLVWKLEDEGVLVVVNGCPFLADGRVLVAVDLINELGSIDHDAGCPYLIS